MARDEGLKHAFRRSENGLLFGKFSVWQVLTIGIAEIVGTALLLFLGCMGLIKGLTEQEPTHLQTSLAFGLFVATIIQMIGHISKAHLNPAVTVCAVLLGDINIPTGVVYVVAELIGAIVGFGLLKVVTPDDLWSENNCCEHCVTLPGPGISDMQALVTETVITSVLIFVVCSSWDKRNANNQDSVPLKFGFLVAGISIAAGPYTGASMNPARSFGPSLWNGAWRSHWIYWVGPLLGSVVTTFFYKFVFNRESNDTSLEDHDVPLTIVNSGNKPSHISGKQGAERSSKEELSI